MPICNSDLDADQISNGNSHFSGLDAAETLDDYGSGLNHTLPTNHLASDTGGLSVKDFLKFQTTLRLTEKGLASIGSAAVALGRMEGVMGQTRSVEIRMK